MSINTRNTIIICAVMVLCTAALMMQQQWPKWQSQRASAASARQAQGDVELEELIARQCPQEEMADWLNGHSDHGAHKYLRHVVYEMDGTGLAKSYNWREAEANIYVYQQNSKTLSGR